MRVTRAPACGDGGISTDSSAASRQTSTEDLIVNQGFGGGILIMIYLYRDKLWYTYIIYIYIYRDEKVIIPTPTWPGHGKKHMLSPLRDRVRLLLLARLFLAGLHGPQGLGLGGFSVPERGKIYFRRPTDLNHDLPSRSSCSAFSQCWKGCVFGFRVNMQQAFIMPCTVIWDRALTLLFWKPLTRNPERPPPRPYSNEPIVEQHILDITR